MDSRIVFRDARAEDAAVLAADLREADLQELRAMHGDWASIEVVLADGIARSSGTCWAAFLGDQMLMLGGAAPGAQGVLSIDQGVPWMLASDAMARRGGALTAAARRYLALMHARYPFLANYVDARHAASIRWLKRLGFTVADQAMPAGPYGMPFHSFWKEA